MTNRTIQTYNRIAQAYHRANRDRSNVLPFLHRFINHMPDRARIADIGCGPGFDTQWLRERGFRTVGFDLSSGMLRTARAQYGGAFVHATMQQLPLARVLDGILANASLLHIPRDAVSGVLSEFYRVLRPNGVLGLALKAGDGTAWEPASYGHTEPRFFTFWQADALDAKLNQAGFAVVDGWVIDLGKRPWLLRLARAHAAEGA